MLYNTKSLYTPALEPYELNERALIIDTETLGAGPTVEIIEVALADSEGRVIYESLVRPVFNRLPPPSRHERFPRAEIESAPEWPAVWEELAPLVDNRLLVAYNAAFDRRALAATCSRYRQRTAERGWRCVMQLAKRLMGAKKSVTLEAACAHFRVEAGNHRAARDVRATHALLMALLKESPPGGR